MRLNPVVPAITLECMRRVSQNRREIAKNSELHQRLPLIGWREWIALPDLDVAAIKAKVDTGARSSSLHAYDVSEFRRGKSIWLRFTVAPTQRSLSNRIITEAPLVEYRSVRIERELGFRPRKSVEDAVRETVARRRTKAS